LSPNAIAATRQVPRSFIQSNDLIVDHRPVFDGRDPGSDRGKDPFGAVHVRRHLLIACPAATIRGASIQPASTARSIVHEGTTPYG
jgi:hypothetical protein